MVYAELGSISSGTMRPEDLIPTFVSFIQQMIESNKDQADFTFSAEDAIILAECEAIDFTKDDEDRGEQLTVLFDIMEQFAPEGSYFGSHEGDGADYGFWLVDQSGSSIMED